MNKICTSQEQSKKLIKLGIDVNTADMVWQSIEDDESFDGTWEVIPKCNSLNVGYKDDVPAWSLSALLELMPLIIMIQLIFLKKKTVLILLYINIQMELQL